MYIPDSIYVIDILFFFVGVLTVLRGMRRGFYRELAGVLTLVILLYGFYFGDPNVKAVVVSCFDTFKPIVQSAISLVILVFLSVVFYLGIRIFSEEVLQARLGFFTDKFSGIVMGLIRGVVLLMVLLAIFSEIPGGHIYRVITHKSVLGRIVDERLVFWNTSNEDDDEEDVSM